MDQDDIFPDYTESIKLGFEVAKQLTTLNAGSIVVIGTFLSNIFPTDKTGNSDGILVHQALDRTSFCWVRSVASSIGYRHVPFPSTFSTLHSPSQLPAPLWHKLAVGGYALLGTLCYVVAFCRPAPYVIFWRAHLLWRRRTL